MNKTDLRRLVGEMVRYGAVGVLNTLLGVALMAGGAWLGWHYALYSAVSYLIAMVFSFGMNAWLTFGTRDLLVRRFVRFLAVGAAVLGIVQVWQWVLIDGMAVAEWIGVGTGMVVYTGLGFVLNKVLVFGGRL